VIKDAIMMGAALVTMADSAKAYLRKRNVTPQTTVAEREPALVSAA
jgi:reactive chlorine resistance protein C